MTSLPSTVNASRRRIRSRVSGFAGVMSMTAMTLGAFGRRATAAVIAARAAAPAGEAAVTISVVGGPSPAPAVAPKSDATRNMDAPTRAVARTAASFEVEATKLRAGGCFLNARVVKCR